MIYKTKKKAFTLTELLVVVLIIGVLSAVALPKFNRVIETRRTGEAEAMLSAVRSEQEKRCSLDQKYASDFTQLGDIVANASTNSFTYALTEKGVNASSKGKAYSVKMPSYRDGRLCCEGAYCESLNKNYPDCAALTDLKEETECLPVDPCAENPNSCACPAYAATHCECTGTCPPPDPCEGKTCSGPTTQDCPAGTTGTQTRTCNCGVWSDWTGSCTAVPCTFGTWSKVPSKGANTCGSTPTFGCVEYADCGSSDKPCDSGLVPQSETQTMNDFCGSGIWVMGDCFGSGNGGEAGSQCVASKTANCPANPCSTLKAGESCIASVSSTCGGYEDQRGTDDFSPGGPQDCRWWGYLCDKGTTTTTTITCQAATTATYYKRTCN